MRRPAGCLGFGEMAACHGRAGAPWRGLQPGGDLTSQRRLGSPGITAHGTHSILTTAPRCRTPVPRLRQADRVGEVTRLPGPHGWEGHAEPPGTHGGAGAGCGSHTGRPPQLLSAQPPAARSVRLFKNQVPASYFSLHTWGQKSRTHHQGPEVWGFGQRLGCTWLLCPVTSRGAGQPHSAQAWPTSGVLLRVRGALPARPGPGPRRGGWTREQGPSQTQPTASSEASGRFNQKVQISKFTGNVEQERQTPRARPQPRLGVTAPGTGGRGRARPEGPADTSSHGPSLPLTSASRAAPRGQGELSRVLRNTIVFHQTRLLRARSRGHSGSLRPRPAPSGSALWGAEGSDEDFCEHRHVETEGETERGGDQGRGACFNQTPLFSKAPSRLSSF